MLQRFSVRKRSLPCLTLGLTRPARHHGFRVDLAAVRRERTCPALPAALSPGGVVGWLAKLEPMLVLKNFLAEHNPGTLPRLELRAFEGGWSRNTAAMIPRERLSASLKSIPYLHPNVW